MYCPACGVENSGEDRRFCRSCGTDLHVVTQALNKSLPVKMGHALDSYLENRFQRKLHEWCFEPDCVHFTSDCGNRPSDFGLDHLREFPDGPWHTLLVLGISGFTGAIFRLLRNKNHWSRAQIQKNSPHLTLN